MFAKWVFRLSGIYGILVVGPMYFLERWLDAHYPPAITHPEFYYGFAGVTLAWQLVYLAISTDPVRYRPLMLVGVLAKGSYIIAVAWLFLQHRIAAGLASSAFGDLFWAILFIVSYLRTPALQGRNT